MTPLATLVLIANLLCDTFGQLAFKAASGASTEGTFFQRWKSIFSNYWIWAGLLAYTGEIVLWMALLSMIPLSMAVLVGSVNILGVMIGGRIFFSEKLNLKRVTAVALIFLGVILVGWT